MANVKGRKEGEKKRRERRKGGREKRGEREKRRKKKKERERRLILPIKGLETDSVRSQSYYRPIHRRLHGYYTNTISTLSNLALPSE